MNKRGKIEKLKKYAKASFVVFLVALVLLITACVAYGMTFSDKVLPKTFFATKDISNFSKDALAKRVSLEASQAHERKIVLKKNDKNWELSFDDAGWKIDEAQTVEKIFSHGHSGVWYQDLFSRSKALIFKEEFYPNYDFNEEVVENWLNGINKEVGKSKQETNILVKNSKATIIESSKGEKINSEKVKNEILNQFAFKSSGDIPIEMINDDPIITKQEAEPLKQKAIDLCSEKITLIGPKGSVEIKSSTLGQMIELKKDIKEKSFLSGDKFGPAYVSFSESKIREILEKESNVLSVDPIDATFSIVDGKVQILSNSTNGKTIKMDESIRKIILALENGEPKEIELPWKDEEAAISARETSDISKYGIEELIATGSTSFKGSTANRIQNIKVGVKFISGTILKPGEEFSTISHLGSIDGSSGYLQELVIKENETIPEFGGGLCQVSTTLFRSVMNAGLEITERHNHSYRVNYYEPPVGMDATIYYPKPDFKFRNNTDNYMLIQGRVEGTKITFDFYGKKDNRIVEITDPVMYDVTPPPADVYVDDASLATGEVKQISKAHEGAKTYFYYRVTKDGKTQETKFTSYYEAWPAKYLRGPQQEGQQQ